MIDLRKSAEINGVEPIDLYIRFKRFPGSEKQIICYCENCGKQRKITYNKYRDLCHKCGNANPIRRERLSNTTTKHFSHQKNRDDQSKRLIDYFSHQENRDKDSKKLIKYWSHQENRDNMSEIKLNSESTKIAIKKMVGGNDIVKHHYIYDHNDLSLYATEMTRSKHTIIHWCIRKSGIEIPHINNEE